MRLRRFREADAQHLYALDNDPAVMRYINGGTHTPYDVICKEILPVFLRRDEAFELGGFWAAEELRSGAFVGWFSYRPTDTSNDEMALGYRPGDVGQGLCHGVGALIDE
jgi:RimJ/RimL family protein N-acetyltransferase|tara:strand:+ start:82 stop:408 length:327 start_codon:yes stop_codon:yes gene_type:complete